MLIHTRCPIDGTDDHDEEVYPASFDVSRVSAQSFSARRMPDRVHYRMVRNSSTGCLRADPILDEQTIDELYRDSSIAYEDIASYTARTYLRYIHSAVRLAPGRRGVLEIGCGHGFLLEHLQRLGFEKVVGIEPSEEAVSKASPGIRPHILTTVLRPGLLPPESSSLVCAFQVLDHLVRPNEALQLCHELLAPDGVMLCICHDEGSPWSRLLGPRSPIVDIAHVVLYNRATIRRLFEKNGFEVLRVFGVSNTYPLGYWAHLAPLPTFLKSPLLKILKLTRLARVPFAANFGNMGILARKSGSDASEPRNDNG